MPQGEWTPPEAGDAPEEIKSILKSTYSTCRDENPGEDPEKKEKCAKIAWGAVRNAGWKKNADEKWIKSESIEGHTMNDFEQFNETTPAKFPKIREDGTARIRIIEPGWGASGYYSKEMLARDAARVYAPGLHMYLDHPTTTEEKSRPERSVKDLAAVIQGNVTFENDNPYGPGVYADAMIFTPFRKTLNEIAPYIGLSHRAFGKSESGMAEGRSGRIIKSLETALSVDFVTLPGAGGKIVQMFESMRGKRTNESIEENMAETKETVLTVESLRKERPDLVDALKEVFLAEIKTSEETQAKEKEHAELLKEVARLKEAQVLHEATAMVGKTLAKASLPDVTKQRLQETLPKMVVVKEGKIDETAFTQLIEAAIKTEAEYIAKLTEAGKVKGFGGSGAPAPGTVLKESFKQAYLRQGLSPEEAEKRAAFAAEGR